ncbi:putative Tyrosine phosphatase [Seiridium cardinale]
MADPSLPSPPFIFIDGLPNFRDIGGYPINSQPGKVVREGVVFRSSEPSNLTEQGIASLQALQVTDVYDLRSLPELQRDAQKGHGRQPKEWPGSNRIFAPVFLDDDYSQEAIAHRIKGYAEKTSEGFVQAYQDILNSASSPKNVAQPYRTILQHLAASGGGMPTPVLLHCTAGKDRTGVICALILSLCGVEDRIVAHEYSLTAVGLKARRGEILRHLLKEPDFQKNPSGAVRMIGARAENMIETLKKIREKWGSVEKCVVDLKFLAEDEIEYLRKNLIVDASSQEGSPLDWEAHAKLVPIAEKEAEEEGERIAAEGIKAEARI